MRSLFILCLFFIFSCSHSSRNNRRVAFFFQDIQYGDVDLTRSQIRAFPPERSGNNLLFYFYAELRDEQGDYIDRDLHEFVITNEDGRSETFDIKRVKRGRYYLILEKDPREEMPRLNFEVAGIKLREKLRLPLRQASRKYSAIRILEKKKYRVKFLLTLADEQGAPVEALQNPEIILNGKTSAHVESVEHISGGNWEISVLYPEENQLFYLSVRSLGITFKNLFRFQHIEN